MDNVKDDRYYVKALIEDIGQICQYAKRVDFSAPEANIESLDAMNFRMIKIREEVGALSPAFKIAHPKIDYQSLVDLRDTITHDYGHVDYSVYKRVVLHDLPAVSRAFKKYLG
jgi:uncharacterized protein with HEPN domain